MDKRFVIPGLYFQESESLNFITSQNYNAQVNGSQILTVANPTEPVLTTNHVIDLGGTITITTITQDGAAITPTTFKFTSRRSGDLVTVYIPKFNITAVSTTGTTIIRILNLDHAPAKDTATWIGFTVNNIKSVPCKVTFSNANNRMEIIQSEYLSPAAFAVPFGAEAQLVLQYIAVPL